MTENALQECEIYAPGRPTIRAERMLRIQRYTDLDRVRPAIRRAAEAAARTAEDLAEQQVCYRKLDIVSCADGELMLETGAIFRCEAFDRLLANAQQVVVFVLTVGKTLDSEVIERLETDDLLEALFLETAGWLCIEDATRKFVEHLRGRAAKQALRLTRRLGPGYTYKTDTGECEWPLSDQRVLFDVFEPVQTPVALLESSAMLPKMSRSGMVGLRPV